MSLSPRLDTIEENIRTVTPNLLINGALAFCQRGTSTSSATATPDYLAPDRWSLERSGGGATTIDRATDAPSTNLKYSLRGTSGDTTAKSFQFWQRVETENMRPYIN